MAVPVPSDVWVALRGAPVFFVRPYVDGVDGPTPPKPLPWGYLKYWQENDNKGKSTPWVFVDLSSGSPPGYTFKSISDVRLWQSQNRVSEYDHDPF